MVELTDRKAKYIKPGDNPMPHGKVDGLWLEPSTAKGTAHQSSDDEEVEASSAPTIRRLCLLAVTNFRLQLCACCAAQANGIESVCSVWNRTIDCIDALVANSYNAGLSYSKPCKEITYG